ncbi:unnamed protein product [Penicillium salamii]|nr:unnamed protein product [Penicillium salamii]
MFTNGLLSWFSKESPAPEAVWDASTATVQNQQPTSPKAPSTDQVITEQPNSHENMMKLRGGGAGDVCCGVCAGLLCFECCEDCC